MSDHDIRLADDYYAGLDEQNTLGQLVSEVQKLRAQRDAALELCRQAGRTQWHQHEAHRVMFGAVDARRLREALGADE